MTGGDSRNAASDAATGPLDLGALATAMRSYRMACLLTHGPSPYPHAVAVTVTAAGDTLEIADAGRRSRSHIEAGSTGAGAPVTLLWPPADPDGHSLIVDADAELDGERVRARPRRAVLHRALLGPAPEHGCTADCVELLPTGAQPTGAQPTGAQPAAAQSTAAQPGAAQSTGEPAHRP